MMRKFRNICVVIWGLYLIWSGGVGLVTPASADLFYLSFNTIMLGLFVFCYHIITLCDENPDLETPEDRAEWCKAHNVPPHYLLVTMEEMEQR